MKKLKLFLAILIALAVVGIGSLANNIVSAQNSQAAAPYKIVGYTPSWGAYDVAKIQYNKLTHICYAFMIPQADGTFSPIENPERLKQVVSLAHAQGVKVSIAIGGWNAGTANFSALASTAATRTKFVNNVMAFVEQYNLDGVDMDWEYPQPGSTAGNFTLLMKEFATALHAKGKELSAAVVALGYTAGGIEDEVLQVIDFLNIMAYDGNAGAGHSPYSYAVDSLNYWLGRGLAREKAILGVPFYSRPGWTPYNQLVALNPANANLDFVNGQYYNGIPTITKKSELAKQIAGGVMMWELSQDTHDETSLLSAIHKVLGQPLIPDNEAPTVPQSLTGTGGMAKASLNWTASTDNIGVVAYNVYRSNANPTFAADIVVTKVRTNSAELTDIPEGTYNFTVSALDAVGNESAQSTSIQLVITKPISNYPNYTPGTIYTGGDRVLHNGREWEAKWWTQNQEPGTTGEWGVWRDLGVPGTTPAK